MLVTIFYNLHQNSMQLEQITSAIVDTYCLLEMELQHGIKTQPSPSQLWWLNSNLVLTKLGQGWLGVDFYFGGFGLLGQNCPPLPLPSKL